MIKIKHKITGEVILEIESLHSVNLSYADLRYADLSYVNLSYADLSNANLIYADFSYSNLRYANLRNADLSNADLHNASLHNANLHNVNLYNATGNGQEIKTLQTERYIVNITRDRIQIGCENHSIEEWKNFNNNDIRKMDGNYGFRWWETWKPIILKIAKLQTIT